MTNRIWEDMNKTTVIIILIISIISCAREPIVWQKVSTEIVEPSLFLHKKIGVAYVNEEKVNSDTLNLSQIGIISTKNDTATACRIIIPWPTQFHDKPSYFTISVFDTNNHKTLSERDYQLSPIKTPLYDDADLVIECKTWDIVDQRMVAEVRTVYKK